MTLTIAQSSDRLDLFIRKYTLLKYSKGKLKTYHIELTPPMIRYIQSIQKKTVPQFVRQEISTLIEYKDQLDIFTLDKKGDVNRILNRYTLPYYFKHNRIFTCGFLCTLGFSYFTNWQYIYSMGQTFIFSVQAGEYLVSMGMLLLLSFFALIPIVIFCGVSVYYFKLKREILMEPIFNIILSIMAR